MFSLESRLQFESFDTLDDRLKSDTPNRMADETCMPACVYLLWKWKRTLTLWPKPWNKKLFCYFVVVLCIFFLADHLHFEPQTNKQKTSKYPEIKHSHRRAATLCLSEQQTSHLTLWEPAYDIFVPRFRPKNSSFQLHYQRPIASADCAKELFKGSNGSPSLLDCTRKKNFGWGLRIFCECRHKWSSFGVILAHVS